MPNDETAVSSAADGWIKFQNAEGKTLLVCVDDIPAGSGTDACPAAAKQQRDYCVVAGAVCVPNEDGNAEDGGAPNTVTIRWTAPTKNSDDTPITNLAGYRIYSGTTKVDGSAPSANELGLLKLIGDKTATSYVAPGFAWGKYYFAMSAHNSTGQEGARTEVVFVEFIEPVIVPGVPTGMTLEVTFTSSTP
jgi:hypothetical protein